MENGSDSTGGTGSATAAIIAFPKNRRLRALPKQVALTDLRASGIAKAGVPGVTHDTRLPGLCIRVSNAGCASWLWRRSVDGKAQQQVLGRVGAIKAEDARRAAEALNGKVAIGRDPKAETAAKRQAGKTLQAAFDEYLRSDLRPATIKGYRAYWKHAAGIAKMPLASITVDNLKALHARLSKTPGPTTANRVLAVVSAIMSREGRRGSNPAREVKRASEQVRTRRLSTEQLAALREVLRQQRGDVWADYFAVMVATGARRSTLAMMRWEQVDLARGVWTVPSTISKNRAETGIALTAEAAAVLKARQSATAGRTGAVTASGWVFASEDRRTARASATGHLVAPEKPLCRFLSLAGINATITCHDLRRSVGSLLAARGANAAVIAGALGHKSLASAKAYLHLDVDEVRGYLEGL